MTAKSPDAFRTISEVADWLDRPAHVLRFWESKFAQVKPVKRAGGRRYYRPDDMLLLGGIKKLLHDDGMTIKGAQKVLREQGVRYVSALSQPLDDDGMTLDATALDGVTLAATTLATPTLATTTLATPALAAVPAQEPPGVANADIAPESPPAIPGTSAAAQHDPAGQPPESVHPAPAIMAEQIAGPARAADESLEPSADPAEQIAPASLSDSPDPDESPAADTASLEAAPPPQTTTEPAPRAAFGTDLPPPPDLAALQPDPGALSHIAALPGPVRKANRADITALLGRLDALCAHMATARKG